VEKKKNDAELSLLQVWRARRKTTKSEKKYFRDVVIENRDLKVRELLAKYILCPGAVVVLVTEL
jgi:hypothetical protein